MWELRHENHGVGIAVQELRCRSCSSGVAGWKLKDGKYGVVVLWVHLNIVYQSCSFTINKYRQDFKFWQIRVYSRYIRQIAVLPMQFEYPMKRMRFRQRTDGSTDEPMDQQIDGRTNPHIEMLGRI